jgi:dihydrofolate synthase/folylpolyglutamate synthase
MNRQQVRGLEEWLEHIAQVHPREIELGLERIRAVAQRLELGRPAKTVITIAGTNGKGSSAIGLTRVLGDSGARVACYTSPHLERFNERYLFNLDGTECLAEDSALCEAFERIEQARGSISLSYFEHATLAALLLFGACELDYAVLEVGLGGRLDAVNLIDADLTVISSIDLDHQEWLGNDREAIGREKAGILRPAVPLFYGEAAIPNSVAARSSELNCELILRDRDFSLTETEGNRFDFHGRHVRCSLAELSIPHASAALVLVISEWLELSVEAAARSLESLRIPGRLEQRMGPGGQPVLLDVAHNPAAARLLASRLAELVARQQPARVACLLAVLADKDVEGIVSALVEHIDIWYISQVEGPRALTAGETQHRVQKLLDDSSWAGELPAVSSYSSVSEAFRQAMVDLGEQDLLLVVGSFLTVANVRRVTAANESRG